MYFRVQYKHATFESQLDLTWSNDSGLVHEESFHTTVSMLIEFVIDLNQDLMANLNPKRKVSHDYINSAPSADLSPGIEHDICNDFNADLIECSRDKQK